MGERVAIRLAASFGRPGVVAAQRGDDVGDRVAGDSTRRSNSVAREGHSAGGSMAWAASAASTPSATIAARERVEPVVRDEVVGEAQGDGVGAGERRAGQRGVQAEQPGRARQQVGAADVGDEPDADLGHAPSWSCR